MNSIEIKNILIYYNIIIIYIVKWFFTVYKYLQINNINLAGNHKKTIVIYCNVNYDKCK